MGRQVGPTLSSQGEFLPLRNVCHPLKCLDQHFEIPIRMHRHKKKDINWYYFSIFSRMSETIDGNPKDVL